jgi:hypothetical protein
VLGLFTAGAFLGYPEGWAKPLILVIEVALLPTLAIVLALLMNGPPSRPWASAGAPGAGPLAGRPAIASRDRPTTPSDEGRT